MLWGLLLGTVGDALGDTAQVRGPELVAAIRRGAEALQLVGKAELGDKTMLDALLPFVSALDARLAAGDRLDDAWRKAAQAAVDAAEATAGLLPRIGRARPLGERSRGTPDPGAVSMGLVLAAAGDVLAGPSQEDSGPSQEER